MSLRIYWRAARTRCVAELGVAAALFAPLPALAGPDPDPAPRVTAREAIERQLAATPARASELTGTEAAIVMEKYRARIGKMIEPKREIGSERGRR